jgi:hypothetical protein
MSFILSFGRGRAGLVGLSVMVLVFGRSAGDGLGEGLGPCSVTRSEHTPALGWMISRRTMRARFEEEADDFTPSF